MEKFKPGDIVITNTEWFSLKDCLILVTDQQSEKDYFFYGRVIRYPPGHDKEGEEPGSLGKFTRPEIYKLYDPFDDLFEALDELENNHEVPDLDKSP